MSQRNYRNDDAVGNAVFAFFGLIGLIFIALISWIKGWFEIPLIEQIQQLDRKAYWGAAIEPQACPQCQVTNEAHQVTCYQCGTSLIDISAAKKKATKLKLERVKKKLVKAILIFLAIFVIYVVLASLGATLGFY
jgi:hypothetical protein